MRFATTPIASTDTLSWWLAATPATGLPNPQPAGSQEAFTVAGLDSGATYYFVVRATDDAQNISGFSNVAVKQAGSGGSGGLATPSGFTASLAPLAVLLSWEPVMSGGGSGYRLYRRTGTAGRDTLLYTAGPSQASYTDSSVVAGRQYEYRLSTYLGSAEGTPAVVLVSVPSDLLTVANAGIHGYPNPARGSVTLRFRGGTRDGAAGSMHIAIYDLTGRKICDLVHGNMPAGEQAIQWNCRSDRGRAVAPGLYNVILDGPTGRSVTRIALVP
jgi:hypothetical protein